MTQHLHREFVPGCYRCELGLDEVTSAQRRELVDALESFIRSVVRTLIPDDEPRHDLNEKEYQGCRVHLIDALTRSVPWGQDSATTEY